MRRRTAAFLLLGVLVASLLVAAGASVSYSDGTAGLSGAVPERFRDCQGVQYCTYRSTFCAGCHGQYDDMQEQEGAQPDPQSKINTLTFAIDGDEEAGRSKGLWEYRLGQSYTISIELSDKRPEGEYASGAFNLNASAGELSKTSAADNTVRITGGDYHHAGSKNATYNQLLCGAPTCPGVIDNERDAAGEATNTGLGSERRDWRVEWTAPATSEEPYGVAFSMAAMLPNGDGHLNCTYRQCNSTLGYAPQSEWDWFGGMAPRRILCEAGQYPSFAECMDAVHAFVLPPGPPLNTNGTTGAGGEESPGGDGTPAPAAYATLAACAALVAGLRGRRR